MNRYNEVYLDRVRELSSSIFEICLYDLNIKEDDFINKIINSNIIDDLSNGDVSTIGKSSIELIYELLNKKIKKEKLFI